MTIPIPGVAGAAAAAATSTRDYLNLDDTNLLGSNANNYATPNTPQGAKLQAAVNFAAQSAQQGTSRSTIFIAGHINCDDIDEVLIPTTGFVRLLGAGSGDNRVNSPACLRWTRDPGAGKYYVNPGLTPYAYRIEHLTIAGPYSDDPILGGAEPVLASGLFLDTRGIVSDVRVLGCNAGAELTNDHQDLIRCDLRGNVYSVKYGPNATGGLGDEKFDRCYLTDASRASVAVCDSATIAFLRATQGHIGFSPVGFYRYPHFFTAAGSGASTTITGVNITQFVPAAGMKVSGPNIPAGTTIASGGVAGTAGNYSLTLSATPTGTVTKVMIGSRGTFLSGIELDSHSIEGADIEIYDEVFDVWGVGGAVTNVALNSPGESSTFGSIKHWRQTVAATGSGASNQLTGVGLTQFPPQEGMAVTGTNIPAGARVAIGGISGTSGNYTLTLTATPTGSVTQVTVGKPSVGVASMDCASATGMVWRDGGAFCQANHPIIAANTINNVTIDDPLTIMNVIADNLGTGAARPFKIKTAYNANGTELRNVTIGRGTQRNGALLLGAAIVNESVSRGDQLEQTSFQHAQKYRGTGRWLGAALDDYSQGEVAIYCYSAMNEGLVVVRNRSGGSIASTSWLKLDTTNPGGVIAATGPTDGPICGKLQNGGPLAAGAVGQADIFA